LEHGSRKKIPGWIDRKKILRLLKWVHFIQGRIQGGGVYGVQTPPLRLVEKKF